MADPSGGTAAVGRRTTGATAVAAHVEALNLAGLAFATKRLLGKDPRPVTGQFTMWARQDQPGLPSVTRPLWEALAPLGIGLPAGEDAALCDRVLEARTGKGASALEAAQACADRAKAAVAANPLPAGPEGVHDRDAALADAVKDFWRAAATVCTELRTRVVEGDRARAVRLVDRADRVLAEIVERIAVLATTTAAAAGTPVASPLADVRVVPDDRAQPVHVHDGDDVELAATGRLPRSPLGDLSEAEVRAAAFARSERVVEDPAHEPAPVEVLSVRMPRNRIVAPVLFTLVVAGLALYVIFSVLNAPNPLAGS